MFTGGVLRYQEKGNSPRRYEIMKLLLVYPQYPDTFWSFKHALKFISKKAAFPPLGLLTVAARLPAEWEKIGFVAGSGNSNSLKEYSFADDFSNSAIQPFNHSIRYRLKQIDNDGTFVYSKEVEVLNSKPSTYQLSQNFPNPFNPSTVISYQLPVSAQVTLKVFDVLGNEVASLVNLQQEAGSYNVTLDASTLASGTYIYRLIAGDFVSTKKLVVLK